MKTILITGASSGFGKTTAELLAKDGHRLILISRREVELEGEDDHPRLQVYKSKVDVRDKIQVKNLFETLPEEF
jgi:NADP-dependent 3-hydroxy acid dehydrogenase YdfG